MRFRKPDPIPLLFIVASTILLFGLGFWQLQRLSWKEGQIQQMAAAQEQPVLESLPQDIKGLDYRRVKLPGTFLHHHEFHLVGNKQNQGPGFFLVTPFRLEDGRILLVNRGYALQPARTPEPEENDNADEASDTEETSDTEEVDNEEAGEGEEQDGGEAAQEEESPQQEVREEAATVEGIIRPNRQRRMFMPANRVEGNVWFYEDIPAMSQIVGEKVQPLLIEAVGAPEPGVYPIPSDGRIVLRNDHWHYAITWFLLGVIGLVMFAFYHRVPEDKK